MKKLVSILFFLTCSILYSQFQNVAPWMNSKAKSNQRTINSDIITINEIDKAAKEYFSTLEVNKKGSGLKPYERWKYHWNYYTKENGTILPAKDLWKAWEQKNQLKRVSKKINQSNWKALGPYNNSNTFNASNFQQTGQGRVNAIAVDPSNPNTIYIGAPAGGIWKSTDNGVNWNPLTDYLPQIGVSGIAIHPTDSNIIYISTGDDDASDSYSVGVWKSIDGGLSWNNTGNMAGNPNSMNEIYIHPTATETILVATNRGIFKSIDGGAKWSNSLSANILDLKMKPGDPNIWYAVKNRTFYKSTDGGDSFTEITLPNLGTSTRLTLDVTQANPEYVYVVSAGAAPGYKFNGVFKSTDSATTFTKTSEISDIFKSSQAWYDLALTVSSKNADIVYVGVLDIWKSTDGGNDFTKLNDWANPNQPSYTHADIHFMRFINGKFYAGTDGGIYVSEDEGVKFKDLTKNLAISQFYKISVAAQNSNNVVGGLQDNGGFALNDELWRNYHGGDGMEGIADPTNPDTHYGFTQYGGSLNKTTNGGRTSSYVTAAPAAERSGNDSGGAWVTPMASNSKGEIYAGYKNLYKLVNSAWVKQSSLFLFGDISHIEIDPKNDNNIYVSQADKIYRSIDAGVTFIQLFSYKNGSINGIEISNLDSNIAWIVTNSGIYKTENILSTSPTFSDISNNLPSDSKLVVKHHERSGNNSIYVGTTLGVYTLNDTSNGNWEVFDINLPNVAVRDLEINEEDSKLFAATYGRGAFVTDIPRELPQNDLRLLALENTPKNISCSTSLSPSLKVSNQGKNVINSITVNYNFNNGNSETYNWTGVLNSEQIETINIPTINLTPGSYTLNVETQINGDAYPINNTASSSFSINKTSTTPTTLNSFENSGDELLIQSTGITMWELGTPTKTLLNSASSGDKVYVTKLRGNHPDATTGFLYTNCYDLTKVVNPIMAFKMAFDIELDWDHLVVEYRTNQDEKWNILGTANDPNWYNSAATTNDTNQSSLPGKQWTGFGESSHAGGGKNADYHDYSYDLAAFTNESNITFRFKFIADAYTNEEGVAIDDFVINGILSTKDIVLENTFNVYPNPSNDTFNFNWNGTEKATISIFDYTGKLIHQKKNIKTNSYKLTMNNFSKGLYFAKINSDGKQATKKLILK
ncbi:putative secreted protein (Por secretion system target) [Lutibacter sp. Hel_I_33_5]|uniref:T9SS type A sorting domain-containing protein n=1 Tax=Lutibacter sp. Hel_I_33_5 TaxID=1566289 RepID=UPI0011A31624|nr:T9SS type A sorting domain-containing protein [Lutibacter sp. Hel_I_33_5]TVZ56644.1 putative secreted protein (Por secretion system target) [Lutibacter sp. Hel_I_33_5]